MQRFFSTGAVVRRIPVCAPAHVKEIPIPRTAKSTAEVRKHLQHVEDSGVNPTPKPNPQVLAEYFPSADSPLNLRDPEGVWYHIERSRSGNMPVYTDYNKAGGVWTEVRKITGNVGALRNDLKIALGLAKTEIWVKNAAPIIVIKGNRSAEVKKLLSSVF